MMFRAEHGNHAIRRCGNTHGKGMRPAKAGVIRVHGAPLGEPSKEGSASGPPTANTHARKGTSGRTETAPGRQWPGDLLSGESRCKSGSGDVLQGRNLYRTRGLMSVQ